MKIDTILIIEDNASDQIIMKRYLKKAGYVNIDFESYGKAGVTHASATKPDLVLIDTILPDLNGFEVCKLVREALGKETKIIMTTGVIDAVDAVRARNSGADDYVVKTADYALLTQALSKMVENE